MMASSNGNFFLYVTGILWGEATGQRFPSQRPVTRSFDVFFGSAAEPKAEQTVDTPVIWDSIAPIMMPL